eukprot:COSAG02_NODE_20085_length_849_cov_1.020000_1_plen_221_part_01
MQGSIEGKVDAIKCLLEHGADWNAKAKDGRAAMAMAFDNKQLEAYGVLAEWDSANAEGPEALEELKEQWHSGLQLDAELSVLVKTSPFLQELCEHHGGKNWGTGEWKEAKSLTFIDSRATQFMQSHDEYAVGHFDIIAAIVYTDNKNKVYRNLNHSCLAKMIEPDKPHKTFRWTYYHLQNAVRTLDGAKAGQKLWRGQGRFYDDVQDGDEDGHSYQEGSLV